MTQYRLVPSELIDSFQELNLNNYSPENVAQLNQWGIDVSTEAAPVAEGLTAWHCTGCGTITNDVEKYRLLLKKAKHMACCPDNKYEMLTLTPVARNEAVEVDAKCFKFWVSEAARNPSSMARLITHCTTEQEYRDAIMPCVTMAESLIRNMRKAP